MDVITTQWTAASGWFTPLPAWDGPQTLVIVFAGRGVEYDPAPLRDIADAYRRSCITGCSTAGEILSDTVSDETVTVAVVRFVSTAVRAVSEPVTSPQDSYDVGVRIGARLCETMPELTAAFVLSDGLVVNGSALVAGLTEGTSGAVTITGGLAGDGGNFERSWVIADGEPATAHVTAVGLSGDKLAIALSNPVQVALGITFTNPVQPALAIAISCLDRRLVLGARCRDELEAAYSALPEQSKMVGFYSYGEIDAGDAAGLCEVQNQTMTVTTLWESP